MTALSCFWPAFLMVRTQIGNPDGEEKPNKKYYDPRACIRSAEESTVKRMEQCFKDLRCVDVLGLGAPESWQHTDILGLVKGIDNEHGRRIDFWKRLEDYHCSLICASVFGPPFSSCQGNAKERHGATPRWTSLLSSRCGRATSLPYWISCTDRRGYGFHPIVLIRLVTKECLPWRFYVTIVTPWEQN